jgi:hypothetical protein
MLLESKKKTSFLLHLSKNSSITTQTRLAGDLTENLASDLVAKKNRGSPDETIIAKLHNGCSNKFVL